MKGLEIVQLMRDGNDGKMYAAAEKVAERFGRQVLGEKVREWAEEKMLGLDGTDGLDDDEL